MGKKFIQCKMCNGEMSSKAKVCPSCGAKNKKSILRKWWFWVIIIFILGGAFSSDSDGGVETNDLSSQVTDTNKDTGSNGNTSTESTSNLTKGQANALKSAKSYLNYSAFSYTGLIKQLEFENYSNEDAVYAADNCGADWNEQAVKAAESYLKYTAFSREGLIQQLEFEGFTNEQAVYGTDKSYGVEEASDSNNGAGGTGVTTGQKNALNSAKSYLNYAAFSYKGLIQQLEFENYSSEEAVYAADNCGADWKEQAVKSAKSYLDYSSFSRDGLIQQLEFEGFTNEEAVYGAEANGY